MILDLPLWIQMIVFPVVTLGLWVILFNQKNSIFTKIFVEAGYLLVVVPLLILTLLSVPGIFFVFWAQTQGIAGEVTYAMIAVLGALTIIIEYFYLKKQIKELERREGKSFWEWLKEEASAEAREERRKEKLKNKKQAEDYFDEITTMNKKKRQREREEKEKLRKALLGEVDSEKAKQEQQQSEQ